MNHLVLLLVFALPDGSVNVTRSSPATAPARVADPAWAVDADPPRGVLKRSRLRKVLLVPTYKPVRPPAEPLARVEITLTLLDPRGTFAVRDPKDEFCSIRLPPADR
jgi:hypothetical protein